MFTEDTTKENACVTINIFFFKKTHCVQNIDLFFKSFFFFFRRPSRRKDTARLPRLFLFYATEQSSFILRGNFHKKAFGKNAVPVELFQHTDTRFNEH